MSLTAAEEKWKKISELEDRSRKNMLTAAQRDKGISQVPVRKKRENFLKKFQNWEKTSSHSVRVIQNPTR